MSVKFKKLAIATAVGASLGFAGMAQANNSLLFPYVTTSATAYTFVSLFNDPDPAGAGPWAHQTVTYHLYYGYKAVGAAATSSCSHRDFPVEVTEGALLQFEAGYKLDLPTEFADPVGYGATLRLENNRLPTNNEGFLIVAYTGPTAAPAAADVVHGEAAVIDTATGLATTYTAISVANQTGDFTGVGDVEHVSSWYPRNIVKTSWYALPTGTLGQMTPNAGGGLLGRILPNTDATNQGAYGRAENYTSGSVPNNFRCFGTFTVDNLLTAPFNQGGWMSINALTDRAVAGTLAADDILLYKRQQTSAVGSSLDMIQREVAR